MEHTPGSINEGIDVQNGTERGQVEERTSAKLYQQATSDAAFLRNLSTKQESAERVSSEPIPFRSRSVGHQDYASYRQKYLVMYSPFRTFEKKKEKKSMRKKISKYWFTGDKSVSAGFLERVLRFLRIRGANGYVHQVRKSSALSPVSMSI